MNIEDGKYIVSAIVSTYNAEEFIYGCLEDLENQTIADKLEIIVVNSGSEQNEDVIIREFQKRYSNIKYVKTEEREHPGVAVNRAIEVASGRYITIACTDDRHRKDALEIMARALDSYPDIGAVYADSLVSTIPNETFEQNSAAQYMRWPDFSLRQMLIFYLFGPQPMWRRSVHEVIGMFNPSFVVACDYDLFLQLAWKFGALHIREVLGLYLERPDSVSRKNLQLTIEDTKLVLQRYRKEIPLEAIYPKLTKILSFKEQEKVRAAALFDQGNCNLLGCYSGPVLASEFYQGAIDLCGRAPAIVHNLALAMSASGNISEGIKILEDLRSVMPEISEFNLRVLSEAQRIGRLNISEFRVFEPTYPVIEDSKLLRGLVRDGERFVEVRSSNSYWSPATLVMKIDNPSGEPIRKETVRRNICIFNKNKAKDAFSSAQKWLDCGKPGQALPWLTEVRLALTAALQTNINDRSIHTDLSNIRNLEYQLLVQLNKIQGPHLRQLFLEVTKRCNIHCKMCQFIVNPERQKGIDKKDYDMSWEIFEQIYSQIPLSVQSIALYGDGEPLLAPGYDRMFTRLYGTGLGIGFSSNGMLLNKHYRQLFLDKNMGIWISFDGVTKGTFDSIRTGANMDIVLCNIKAMQELKQRYQTQFPVLHFSFTAMRENIEELPGLVRLAAELEIASITVQYMNVSYEYLHHESLYYHQELSNLKMREAEVLGKKLGVNVELPPLFGEQQLGQPGPWRNCKFVNHQMVIYNDGRVKTCACGVVEQFMGDIKKEGLMDIWYGEKYSELRRRFETDTPPLICANCPDLSQRDVNNIKTHIHIPNTLKEQLEDSARKNQLVTVMVRTFNRPDMLKGCLESICNQTYLNIEVVVVNDGGRDVLPIIEEFKSKRPIRYIKHEQNLGRSAGWNSALKAARGKYVAYLDDDDIYYPEHVQTLVEVLEYRNGMVAYTDTYQATQEPVNGEYQITERKVVYSRSFDPSLLTWTNYIPVTNLMHRRDCIDTVGLFDEEMPVLEDWDFLNRLALKYEFIHIPKVTGEYRWRKDRSNTTFEESDKFCKNRAKVWMRYGSRNKGIKPLVSIIILCHNHLEFTKQCVESIHTYTAGPYELVMVDNNSTDGTAEYLKDLQSRHTNIKVIFNDKNLGYAMGNNMGLAVAEGEYLIIMNNDVIVTEDWLSGLLHVAKEIPSIGIVGPKTNYVVGDQMVPGVSCKSVTEIEAFARRFKQENGRSVTLTGRVIGFCMLVKREVIKKIGGFDPRFGIGNFEDDDFCIRAKIAGFEIAIADFVFVYHYGSVSFLARGIEEYRDLLKHNLKRFTKKWGHPESEDGIYDPSLLYQIPFDPQLHYIPFDLDEYCRPDLLPIHINGVKKFRILSLPDWSSEKGEWVSIIETYINTFTKEDDTSLVLYVDTSMGESGEDVITKIQNYLNVNGLSAEEIADTILVATPLPFSARGAVFKSADILMASGDFLDNIHAMEAKRCGLSIINPSDTERLRELYETSIAETFCR